MSSSCCGLLAAARWLILPIFPLILDEANGDGCIRIIDEVFRNLIIVRMKASEIITYFFTLL